MQVDTAQQYLGKQCRVTFQTSYGDDVTMKLKVNDITSTSMYGSFLIGDTYSVNLERISAINVD